MLRLLTLLFFFTLSFGSCAGEIDNIVTMSKLAKSATIKKYKIKNADDLVLFRVSLYDRERQFSKNVLQFQILDKGKYKSDEISEYIYTVYWVSFSLVSGKIVSIEPSTYGSYEPISSKHYYH